MSPESLLSSLRGRGVSVWLDPSKTLIQVRPADALTAEDREAITKSKPQLLALLAGEPVNHVAELEGVARRILEIGVSEADGYPVDDEEVSTLKATRRRLRSEVGPAFSEAVESEVIRKFAKSAGRCRSCWRPTHSGGC